jgi:hypothetical protein
MGFADLFEYACGCFLIREICWLPSIDETYKLVATVAIIVGGIWGVSMWCHQERLRRVKENPGFECQIEVSQSKLSDGDILLAIDVITMNTGVLPLWPATEDASISVKAIDLPRSQRFIEEEADSKADAVSFPAAGRGKMRLEPSTRTVFSAFFKAKANQLYSVQFDLPANDTGQGWHWRKRRVVYASDESAKAEST